METETTTTTEATTETTTTSQSTTTTPEPTHSKMDLGVTSVLIAGVRISLVLVVILVVKRR
jgi:hypothetical protein